MTDPPSGPTSDCHGSVVVGFSTSTSSQNAVRWAAAEAETRKTGLCIVHAFPLPQLGQPVQHDVDDLLRNEASTLLDRIVERSRRDHPHLDITARLIQNAPVNALRDESAGAALIVVGARESGRLAAAILGSVASAVVAAVPVPVAVVLPGHPTHGTGPVVVGMDGSAGNAAAIEFAFAEAAARNAELLAVHVRNESVEHEPAVLAETLAGWCNRYPNVVVTRAAHKGHAASLLLEHSRSASIVVVGRRPRGEFEALVMGSTSRSLIAHSLCPVVIVRSEKYQDK
jgi:nucleotide-binding universal stress UspA family protein